MKKILPFVFIVFGTTLLFAQHDIYDITGENIVRRHFGQTFSQLVETLPEGFATESRDNLLYVFHYPFIDFTSLFFISPHNGVNHYVMFARTDNDLKYFYENFIRIFSSLHGEPVNSELSVFFYENLPEKVSRIELSKPEADTENRNVLLIRWYGY